MTSQSSGKWLRIITYIFFGLATSFTLMGGAGTSCVAFNPTNYGEKFAGIIPLQPLYIHFVVTGLIAGVLQVIALILLLKGKPNGLAFAAATTFASLLVNDLHIVASTALGSSPQPVYLVFGLNLLALIILLVCLIPPVHRYANFEEAAKNKKTADKGIAAALITCGLGVITAPFWGAPSHNFNGFNYANAWPIAMNIIGFGLLVAGVGMLTRPRPNLFRKQAISVRTK